MGQVDIVQRAFAILDEEITANALPPDRLGEDIIGPAPGDDDKS
jgi:hypothetical protein